MIGTLTLHYNSNYGANLQAYALVCAIKKITVEEARLVDYRSVNINNLYAIRPFDITGNRRIHFSVRAIKRVAKMIINPKGTVLRHHRFCSFRKQYIPMTKTITCINQISMLNLDKLLIGSDQVWNTDITQDDEAIFWGASKTTNCKMFSYAASLGKDNFNIKEIEYAKEHINKFDYLTVREEKLAQNIEQLLGKTAYVVCDPALLLSQSEWKSICNKSPWKKNFIVVYQLGRDKKMLEIAVKMAKEKNWDVLYLNDGRNYRRCAGVIHRKVADPIEFVSLINAAEIVMTDSFHGTVFSVIFNKNFYVFPYFRIIRIVEFLKRVGLTERIVNISSSFTDHSDISKQEYEKVNNVLEYFRKESIEHLSNMVNGCFD